MHRFISPRQTGKTTELIKLSATTKRYIVCPNIQQMHYIAEMARDMGLDIPHPVTLEEVTRGGIRGSSINRDGVLIDNLDIIARMLIMKTFQGIPIEGYTMTNSEPIL